MNTLGEQAVPATMRVHAANYRMLMRLLGTFPARAGATAVTGEGGGELRVVVLERSPYTSTVRLEHGLGSGSSCLTDVVLTVRAYHDARVAEVIDYQGGGRLEPRYSYPNAAMRLPDEKRQVNRFLEDWLRYCLRLGLREVAAPT
ncbi:MAG: DUF1249 domain-containing protein [Pseudomonadota bacterium]